MSVLLLQFTSESRCTHSANMCRILFTLSFISAVLLSCTYFLHGHLHLLLVAAISLSRPCTLVIISCLGWLSSAAYLLVLSVIFGIFNPFKPSGIKWLPFKAFSAMLV